MVMNGQMNGRQARRHVEALTCFQLPYCCLLLLFALHDLSKLRGLREGEKVSLQLWNE